MSTLSLNDEPLRKETVVSTFTMPTTKTTSTTSSTSARTTTTTNPPSTTKYIPNYWDLLMNRYGLKEGLVEEDSSLPKQPKDAGENVHMYSLNSVDPACILSSRCCAIPYMQPPRRSAAACRNIV